VVWEYPGFTITPDFEHSHFMIPKWHHSWGAHIIPDAEIYDQVELVNK
jgi:hypothetical protein